MTLKGLGRLKLTTTTVMLLDTLKRKNGLSSDYAAAKALGRTPANVSNWRKEKDQMSPDAVAVAAPLAGLDPAATVAKIEAERAQTEPARNLFNQLHQAAELMDLIKRTPALRAALADDIRQFAQTIENEEERERFMSNAFFACILCQIRTPIRHISCSRPKPARKRFPVLTIAQNKEMTE